MCLQKLVLNHKMVAFYPKDLSMVLIMGNLMRKVLRMKTKIFSLVITKNGKLDFIDDRFVKNANVMSGGKSMTVLVPVFGGVNV